EILDGAAEEIVGCPQITARIASLLRHGGGTLLRLGRLDQRLNFSHDGGWYHRLDRHRRRRLHHRRGRRALLALVTRRPLGMATVVIATTAAPPAARLLTPQLGLRPRFGCGHLVRRLHIRWRDLQLAVLALLQPQLVPRRGIREETA